MEREGNNRKIPLVEQAQAIIRSTLPAGGIAIDATAGNGHDTLFLAHSVGEGGHVYSCDIQSQALSVTRGRLQETGLISRVTLLESSHAALASRLPESLRGAIGAVMFNLGFLPGSDKRLTTRGESTIAALASLSAWLAPEGVITVIGYTGHPGGREETTRAWEWAMRLAAEGAFACERVVPPGGGKRPPPELIVVRRRATPRQIG